MKIVLSGLLVFLIIGSAAGQTIHIDDLDYFVGCFARTDTTDYESVDLSKFIEWKIIKPDPVYKQRKLRDLKYRKDRFWVYYWYPLSAQKGEIKGPMYVNGFDRYRFY